jgi:hypothetical protein
MQAGFGRILQGVARELQSAASAPLPEVGAGSIAEVSLRLPRPAVDGRGGGWWKIICLPLQVWKRYSSCCRIPHRRPSCLQAELRGVRRDLNSLTWDAFLEAPLAGLADAGGSAGPAMGFGDGATGLKQARKAWPCSACLLTFQPSKL